MREYVRSIPVEDASGARFEVHEFLVRRWIRRSRLFELDTGEAALIVDGNTFALVRTGERFVRISFSAMRGRVPARVRSPTE